MNLPHIDLPQIPIPMWIPDMMHPCVVHFAIALPFVILLLEIVNLFVKKRTVGIISFVFALLSSATMIASSMTGHIDAELSTYAQNVIESHKVLGEYLVIISLAVVLFKIFSVVIRTGIVKAIYLMILIIFILAIVKEARSGNELVYKNGVNIQSVSVLQKQLKETSKKLLSLQKQLKSNTPTSSKASTVVEQVKVQDSTTEVKPKESIKSVEVQSDVKEPTVKLQDSISDVDVEEDVTDVKTSESIDSSVIEEKNNTKI